MVNGVLERMIELDYILNQFSKVKAEKMKPVIRTIMRSAVYQLKYMDSVPASAACTMIDSPVNSVCYSQAE